MQFTIKIHGYFGSIDWDFQFSNQQHRHRFHYRRPVSLLRGGRNGCFQHRSNAKNQNANISSQINLRSKSSRSRSNSHSNGNSNSNGKTATSKATTTTAFKQQQHQQHRSSPRINAQYSQHQPIPRTAAISRCVDQILVRTYQVVGDEILNGLQHKTVEERLIVAHYERDSKMKFSCNNWWLLPSLLYNPFLSSPRWRVGNVRFHDERQHTRRKFPISFCFVVSYFWEILSGSKVPLVIKTVSNHQGKRQYRSEKLKAEKAEK